MCPLFIYVDTQILIRISTNLLYKDKNIITGDKQDIHNIILHYEQNKDGLGFENFFFPLILFTLRLVATKFVCQIVDPESQYQLHYLVTQPPIENFSESQN